MRNSFLNNLKQITINKVIAELLSNNRYHINQNEISAFSIIDLPNLDSSIENKERWSLFRDKYWLFNRFIPHCDWFECQLKFPDCLDYIEIINEESWFQKMPPTNRLVKQVNYDYCINDKHKYKIEKYIKNGIEDFINEKYLILIGKYDSETLTILDGNHRFLALYESFKLNKVNTMNIKVIVGLTYGNCRWFGDEDKWEERPSNTNNKRYILNIW